MFCADNISDSHIILNHFGLLIFLFSSFFLSLPLSHHVVAFLIFTTYVLRNYFDALMCFFLNVIFVDFHLHKDSRSLKMIQEGLLLNRNTHETNISKFDSLLWSNERNYFSSFLKHWLLTHIEIISLLTCHWIHSRSGNDFRVVFMRCTTSF